VASSARTADKAAVIVSGVHPPDVYCIRAHEFISRPWLRDIVLPGNIHVAHKLLVLFSFFFFFKKKRWPCIFFKRHYLFII